VPDESEQRALDQIKAYLDAGHSLDAIRDAGWATWVEHLEAKGYDLRTGQPKIAPPDFEPSAAPAVDEAAPAIAATDAPAELAGSTTPAEPGTSSIPTCANCGAERVGMRPYCVNCATKWPEGTPPGRGEERGELIRSKWFWAVGAVGVLLVGLIIVGSVLSAGGDDSGDDTTNPLLVATLDQDAETTDPTITQGQPPREQQPSTQNETSLDVCLDFTEGMADASLDAADSMDEISILTLDAATDPLVVLTADWQNAVTAEYSGLRSARADVELLEAPAGDFSAIKVQVLEAFDLLLASEAPLLTGAENLDADSIIVAGDYLTQATGAFSVATTMIENVDIAACTS